MVIVFTFVCRALIQETRHRKVQEEQQMRESALGLPSGLVGTAAYALGRASNVLDGSMNANNSSGHNSALPLTSSAVEMRGSISAGQVFNFSANLWAFVAYLSNLIYCFYRIAYHIGTHRME